MRRRHLQFWLVILNLVAFNAYALSAASILAPHHARSQKAQVESHGLAHQGVGHQGMEHKGCHEAQQATISHQHPDHCDMPCCKDVNGKASTQSDHCGCKLGSNTLQLYMAMTNNHDTVVDRYSVDATSTAFVLQDRTQRLLRPPIA